MSFEISSYCCIVSALIASSIDRIENNRNVSAVAQFSAFAASHACTTFDTLTDRLTVRFKFQLEHVAHVSRPLPATLVVLGLRPYGHDQAVEMASAFSKTAILTFGHEIRIEQLPRDNRCWSILTRRRGSLVHVQRFQDELFSQRHHESGAFRASRRWYVT